MVKSEPEKAVFEKKWSDLNQKTPKKGFFEKFVINQ